LPGGNKAIETAAGAEIHDPLAGAERPERERIADAGEGLYGAIRQRGDDRVVVTEAASQRPPGMEVKCAVRVDRDRAVFDFHLLA
jgi:hypothetical protein